MAKTEAEWMYFAARRLSSEASLPGEAANRLSRVVPNGEAGGRTRGESRMFLGGIRGVNGAGSTA